MLLLLMLTHFATPGSDAARHQPSDQLTNRPTDNNRRDFSGTIQTNKTLSLLLLPARIFLLLICAPSVEGGKTSQKHINLIALHLLLMKFRINIIPLLFCSHPLTIRIRPSNSDLRPRNSFISQFPAFVARRRRRWMMKEMGEVSLSSCHTVAVILL